MHSAQGWVSEQGSARPTCDILKKCASLLAVQRSTMRWAGWAMSLNEPQKRQQRQQQLSSTVCSMNAMSRWT
eukprot:2599825-Amphidinium_carterae.3